MKRLIASLAAVVSIGALASGGIDTPAFKLKLEGDWKPEKTSDPEQYSYYSKKLDVGLTTSFMLMNAKPSDTKRIAKKLKEFRLEGEDKAAREFNLKMTIAEPIVVPSLSGIKSRTTATIARIDSSAT